MTLARLLGAESFGIYAFAMAIVALACVPPQLGLPLLIVREMAAAASTGRWGAVRGLIVRAHQIVAAGSVAIAALLFLLFVAVPDARGVADLTTLGWALLLVPITGLVALSNAMIRGAFRVALSQVPERIVKPLLIVALALAAAAAGTLSGADVAMLFTVAAAVVSLLASLAIYRLVRAVAVRRFAPEYRMREWIRSMLPLGLINAMDVINLSMGPLLLGYLAAAEDVGVYRIAAQIALLAGFFYVALNSVLAPHFSRRFAAAETAETARLAARGALVATTAAAAFLAGFALAGRPILAGLFGPEFARAYAPALVLIGAQVVNAAFGFAAILLNMSRHELDVTRIFALAVVVNLVAGVALVQLYGLMGAAWAAVITALVVNASLWLAVRVRLRIDSGFWAALRAAGSANR